MILWKIILKKYRSGSETLCIEEFEEDKVNQLWRYKNNFFFNQGLVITSQDDDEGCFLGTDSRTGDDNQQFYVVQKDEWFFILFSLIYNKCFIKCILIYW